MLCRYKVLKVGTVVILALVATDYYYFARQAELQKPLEEA